MSERERLAWLDNRLMHAVNQEWLNTYFDLSDAIRRAAFAEHRWPGHTYNHVGCCE